MQRYLGYVEKKNHIIEEEEATRQQVWKDAMMEQYQSIMKNDVWEVVLRLEGKSMVASKWIYKIKHAADGSVEKYRERFIAHGFSQKIRNIL